MFATLELSLKYARITSKAIGFLRLQQLFIHVNFFLSHIRTVSSHKIISFTTVAASVRMLTHRNVRISLMIKWFERFFSSWPTAARLLRACQMFQRDRRFVQYCMNGLYRCWFRFTFHGPRLGFVLQAER